MITLVVVGVVTETVNTCTMEREGCSVSERVSSRGWEGRGGQGRGDQTVPLETASSTSLKEGGTC